MNEITLKAFAKINLALDVLRKREDGYHDVRMIMQNIRLFDKITMRRTGGKEIRMESNLRFLPTDGRNLMVKAAELMRERFSLPGGLEMILEKHIPVAAGLAGGSTDAASVLYGIDRLYGLELSQEELMEIGVKLGADVPYCLLRKTALAEGIGEKLTVLPACPECSVVIAKPAASVSTKYVYEHLDLNEGVVHPDIDGMIEALKNQDLKGIASRMGNVLESVTEKACPEIASIKGIMREKGALNALMSGSGPTVFGIFDNWNKAEECEKALRAAPEARMCRIVGMFQS